MTTMWADSREWGLVPAEITFGCVISEANWIVLCCGLRLVSGCVGSAISWEGLWYRRRLAAVCV